MCWAQHGGVAFDVAAVCSGFLYAFSVAESMIRAGSAHNALVIGAETFSRILDWEDRTTCVLFGDGAGAVVLSGEVGERGVLATKLHADGRHNQLLYVDGGPSTTGTVGKLRMQGREVFRHAVTNLSNVLIEVLDEAGIAASAIDWVVPHQANARIIDATARKLGLACRTRHHDRCRSRQHLCGFGSAGARCCDPRWPDQARRPCRSSRPWAAVSPGARHSSGCETICACHALVILQHSQSAI